MNSPLHCPRADVAWLFVTDNLAERSEVREECFKSIRLVY